MVAPKLRSQSKKKIKRKTPKGRQAVLYRREKIPAGRCGRCGRTLQGVASGYPSKMSRMSKSEKIPERPYAGVLCADCTEDLLRYQTRFEVKHRYLEFSDLELQRDLTIEKFLPQGWYGKLKLIKPEKIEDVEVVSAEVEASSSTDESVEETVKAKKKKTKTAKKKKEDEET